MKVIAFNGSPRREGNTAILIDRVFQELSLAGIETERISLAGRDLHGCIACYRCLDNRDGHCAVTGDAANEYIDRMQSADGIIIASPSYFQDLTSETKALIDRAGFTARANGRMLRDKVGAAVVVMRRSGAMHALASINHFFLANEMVIAGRALGVGNDIGEVRRDEEGLEQARSLGRRMAWLLERLHG